MKTTLLTASVAILLMCCVSCSRTPTPGTTTTVSNTPAESGDPAATKSAEVDLTVSTRQHDGQVLRHAVFFSFKDASTEADVQSVVDSFRSLPSKIDTITDFQSGTNNSPEGLDDGFTHCFLLTFTDKAGLDEYIPHPAHKGEFADTLRPHMKDVFVFDYWGEPTEKLQKELKHAVFFKFKDESSAEEVQTVVDAFAELSSKINTIKQFEWGLNNSGEGKDDGFTHCFMVTFDTEEGRDEYLPHPDHQAFVEILKPHLDKVRVLDFWGERVQ